MKVSSVGEDINIAVVGGKESTAAGLSQSAEFMLNLADGLYSNKPLAASREVLCNGWDIHILTGITDKHIDITYDEIQLTFRDYGPGIPFDVIEDVYMVYGASTKVHSEEETGGFGLGSKSPWAVTDQFMMSNARDGVKVTYTCIKSDPTQKGKPSIRELFRIPSEETGVTVSIPLTSESLGEKMVEYAKTIAYWADIKLKINDIEQPIADFSKIAEGQKWVIIPEMPSTAGNGSFGSDEICVRVGSVIYPVPRNERYNRMYDQVAGVLGMLPNNDRLLLFAKPGKVMMTPSRESLSMTETTIESIHDLLYDFCEHFNEQLQSNAYKIATEMLEAAAKTKEINHFIPFDNPKIPNVNSSLSEEVQPYIHDTKELVTAALRFQTPSLPNFAHWLESQKRYIFNRDFAEHQKLDKRYYNFSRRFKAAPFYQEARRSFQFNGQYTTGYQKLMRDILWKPLALGLKETKNLSRLDINMIERVDSYYYDNTPRYMKLDEARKNGSLELNTVVRKIVIIASTATDLIKRMRGMPVPTKESLDHHTIVKDGYYRNSNRNVQGVAHQLTGSLLVLTKRSKARRNEAVKLFTEMGYTVYDTTERLPWEPEPTKEEVAAVVAAKAKAALPVVFPVWSDIGKFQTRYKKKKDINQRNISSGTFQDSSKMDRVTQPETLLSVDYYGNIDGFIRVLSSPLRDKLYQMYAHKTGVVWDNTELRQYLRKKRMKFSTIMQKMLEEIYEEFSTSEVIRNNYHFYMGATIDSVSMYEFNLYETISSDPVLSRLLTYKREPISERQKFLLSVWREASSSGWSTSRAVEESEKELMDKIYTLICTYPMRREVQEEANRLSKLPLMPMLDWYQVQTILKNRNATYHQICRVKLLISHILKG